MANHVQYGTEPPPELKFVNRVKNWGNPTGGGWLDWPAGMVDKASIVNSVYHSFIGYLSSAGKTVEWANRNPQSWELVSWVLAYRMGHKE